MRYVITAAPASEQLKAYCAARGAVLYVKPPATGD